MASYEIGCSQNFGALHQGGEAWIGPLSAGAVSLSPDRVLEHGQILLHFFGYHL